MGLFDVVLFKNIGDLFIEEKVIELDQLKDINEPSYATLGTMFKEKNIPKIKMTSKL